LPDYQNFLLIIFQQNYFGGPTKLFSDVYPATF